MMEFPDDSRGSSAVIHGSEACIWHRIVDKGDLLNLYLCAGRCRGPLFTRQAMSGDRLNAARLDRVYTTNHTNWFEHIISIDHDGRQTLSDHVPVIVNIALTPPPASTGFKKSSYFKFDHTYFQSPAFLAEAKQVWGQPRTHEDPRSFWNDAFCRLERIMKREKQARSSLTSSLDVLRQELEQLRATETNELQIEERTYIQKLEQQVQEAECREALLWRTRSRTNWLSIGEAPSSFFVQLKAKHSRDTIHSLQTKDQSIVTEDLHVLDTVHKTFADVFTL
jgi:hypothetical protein